MGRVGIVQRAPECGGPELQAKFLHNNFPVTVKIGTSGYQTLECFIATFPTYGVLCTWAVMNCTKMRLAAVIRGRGSREELGNRKGEKGEGREI